MCLNIKVDQQGSHTHIALERCSLVNSCCYSLVYEKEILTSQL